MIFFLLLMLSIGLASCSIFSREQKDGPPKHHVNINKIPNAKPKVEPRSRYGNPPSYVVHGKRYYVLKSAKNYNKIGYASWYGTKFHNHLTSSREPYSMFAMTGASRDLPLPTYVRVTNLKNGRWIIVKVNDRGPFKQDRIIDLTYVGAKKLGFVNNGTALVQVTAINPRTYHKQPIYQADLLEHHLPAVYLQTGAYTDLANAKRLQVRLFQLTQQKTQIKVGIAHNRQVYRVLIGPLVGVKNYDQIRKKLVQNGFAEPIIVPIKERAQHTQHLEHKKTNVMISALNESGKMGCHENLP